MVVCRGNGQRFIYRDLGEALVGEPPETEEEVENGETAEWRIHYHVPLHSPPTELFDTTSDHILGVMDLLAANPEICTHLEMETYTWEVLPAELKDRDVVDQLAAEYEWTLGNLRSAGWLEFPIVLVVLVLEIESEDEDEDEDENEDDGLTLERLNPPRFPATS